MSPTGAGVRRVRDLTVVDLPATTLVLACDSIGGIGPKPADTVAASARDVAHFATRVALLEVIAAGAEPIVVVDALCVEAEPTGAAMIAEVRRLAATLGLDPAVAVTGSTEDNVPTRATGIGVTVLGVATGPLRAGTSEPGDVVVALGAPRSAPHDEVRIDDPVFCSLTDLRGALALDGVHDAVPVGSHGVAYEMDELARPAGLVAVPVDAPAFDLRRSGGPATTVLVSVRPDALPALRALRPDLPVAVIGHLEVEPRP